MSKYDKVYVSWILIKKGMWSAVFFLNMTEIAGESTAEFNQFKYCVSIINYLDNNAEGFG